MVIAVTMTVWLVEKVFWGDLLWSPRFICYGNACRLEEYIYEVLLWVFVVSLYSLGLTAVFVTFVYFWIYIVGKFLDFVDWIINRIEE